MNSFQLIALFLIASFFFPMSAEKIPTTDSLIIPSMHKIANTKKPVPTSVFQQFMPQQPEALNKIDEAKKHHLFNPALKKGFNQKMLMPAKSSGYESSYNK